MTALRLILVCISVAFCAACAASGFIHPVADYQAAIGSTADAVSGYYAQLNSFERELYLQERALDSTLSVALQSSGKSTPFAGQVFSAEAIKARTDAIALLGVYGKRLAALAGSNVPSEVSANIASIGSSISTLGDRFGKLEGDASASKYVGPVSALVGLIAQSILEEKRDALLTQAIKEGAPQVDVVVTLLEADMTEVVGPLRLSGTKQSVAALIQDYNARRSTMSLDDRRKSLEQLRLAQERFESAVVFSPTELFGAFRDAHTALLKYATSHRKRPDALELAAALDVFRSRAEVAAQQILALKALGKAS